MTLSSSLNAGVAGLNANASRLGTISDNIANSGTFGYKRSTAEFHSMVIESGNGAYSAGGVRTTTQRLIDERGPLLSTTNATDLAVRGRGMLPVTSKTSVGVDNGTNPMLLTTTGSFRTDTDGYLTTPGGLVLLGWPANSDGTVPPFTRDTSDALVPVQVNVNQVSGQPTTRMSLGVNLPATETEPGADGQAQELSVEYFDNLGTSESIRVTFTPNVADPVGPPVVPENTWTLALFDTASNQAVGNYNLTFNDDRNNGGTLANVTSNNVPGSSGWDPATGEIEVTVGSGPVAISLGAQNTSDGLTQLSDVFAPVSITKDGAPVGNLTSVEIDSNGFVQANYDVGITRTIYQIPLVDVPNTNGLRALDQQTFGITTDSGPFFLWDAGDGPTGDIVSYAREESTTDVAGELTNLIQTQRAYSSNAKVIQTVDEMLQETTNIKR